MQMTFFSSAGWTGWDVAAEPAVPDRMPVLIDDDLLLEDAGVARPCVAASRWLRELPVSGAPSPATWAAYARVLRDWMSFLSGIGVEVFGTRERLKDALGAYAAHRAAGPIEARFAASTWNQHVSVLSAFYQWAAAEGEATAVPFSYAQARSRYGHQVHDVQANLARRRVPKPHVRIKYLEAGFAAMLVNALSGLRPDGTADAGYRGRELARNAAITRMVLATGLRRREFTFLLSFEVPPPPPPGHPVGLPVLFGVSATLAKGSKFRTTWIDAGTLAAVHSYIGLDRAASTAGSSWLPPARWGEPLRVSEPGPEGGRVNGFKVRWASLTAGERRRLVAPDGGSCLLAVCSGGGPFTAWESVLTRVSHRIRDRFEPRFPLVHPHRLRHSMAMATLERLVGGFYVQAAQLAAATGGGAGPDAALALYLAKADPLMVLRDLLGHSSALVTEACEFSNGRRRRLLVGESGALELARDLLTALAGLVWPHGGLDTASTVGGYLTGLRDICRFMAAREVSGGAAALTRAVLAEYWMQAGLKRERATRRMLLGFAGDGGALGAGVADLAAGRRFSPGPGRDPLAPYEHEQWAHLQATCRRIIDESFAAHQRAVAAVGRGHDPAGGQWSQDNLRQLMLHRGPFSAAQAARYLGVPARHVYRHGGIRAVVAELFPDGDVVLAYQLLLGCYSGVVPDGIADLGVGDVDWAGDAAVLLTYIKGRTAAESVTLPRRAVRLLEQWLQHSAITRRHAPAQLAAQLWLHCSSRSDHRWQKAVDSERQRLWGDRHGIAVDRRRVRTTNLSLRDRGAWHGSGRSLIDPNHSAQVEADHYLTATTPAQQEQVDSIIEQGQSDMVRRAAPPVVLSGDQLAGLAVALPAALAGLGLAAAAAGALVSGSQDVFVASCTDPLSGRHGPPGKPCPARPWVCLLCPLAIFAPRHAANLLRLKAFFARQWRQMPGTQFMATFGPYAARIDQILRLYPPGALADLAVTISDDDSELPLRPEEGTR